MTSAPHILYFCEPHPIRNSYTEHLHIARQLVPILSRYAARGAIRLRVFGNSSSIDKLLQEVPQAAAFLQRPNRTESARIARFYGRWDEGAIARWLDLVQGRGEVTEIYIDMLERLHRDQPIDGILCWSENGALRRFASQHGIALLHGEMGPTRAPFPETVYFDPDGTNGNARFRARIGAALAAPAPDRPLAPAFWMSQPERSQDSPDRAPFLRDSGVSFDPDFHALLPPRPYLYVPLQLADDLNILTHSPYDSPKQFLLQIAEQAADLGYDLLVKPHPGVAARPYNARHQIEALLALEAQFPAARQLPQQIPPQLGCYVMANAAYTVSINSSMSFESMILGVPGLVLGQAAFDGGGWMQTHIPLKPAAEPREFQTQIAALVETHMRHLFLPRAALSCCDYLLRRLLALAAGDDLDPLEEEFTEWHLYHGSPAQTPLLDPLPDGSMIGAPAPRKGDILRETDQALLLSRPDQAPYGRYPIADLCAGHLEHVTTEGDDTPRIAGWVLDHRTRAAPAYLLLVIDDAVWSTHRVMIPRPDVAQHYGLAPRLRCGFQFELANAPLDRARLFVMTQDGQAHRIGPLITGLAIGATKLVPADETETQGPPVPATGPGMAAADPAEQKLARAYSVMRKT